jgi:hypothetical protein
MSENHHTWARAFAAGTVGAVALTAVHQLARRVTENAPRMDVVGRRAIEKGMTAAGAQPPEGQKLQNLALAGDLFANSAYYSLIACGRNPHVWRRATALGLAAGAGALLLPRYMGLGDPPRSTNAANQVMTVAWYLLGGLATAAATRMPALSAHSRTSTSEVGSSEFASARA